MMRTSTRADDQTALPNERAAEEPGHRTPALGRLAAWCFRRRRRVVLVWLAVLVGSIGLSSAAGGEFRFSFATPGSESQEALELLESRFPGRAGDQVDVVFRSDAGMADPATTAAVDRVLDTLGEAPHVDAVVSPFDSPSRVAGGGHIAYATLRLDVTVSDYPVEDGQALIELARGIDEPGLQVELGGFAIQNAEQTEFSSEAIGLLVAAVILLVSFGSVLAMGLPILTALFGLGVGLSSIAVLANVVEVPDFAPQVAAMIGIGVGIDYVLLIVTRYRAALHDGTPPLDAVVLALTTSGRAVLFAGCTVIVSLLGLFLMNLGFLRGLAVGASCVVLVVMLAAVTLLPAVLGFVGTSIDRLHVPGISRRAEPGERSLSRRWSATIQRHPWPAAIVCAAALVALALPTIGMDFGFPDAGNSPEDLTTRRAYDLLDEGFGPGFNGPLMVVVERAEGDASQAAGVVAERLATDPGVAQVLAPQPNPAGDVAMVQVLPTTSPQSQATEELVDRLRDDVLPSAAVATDSRILVGGITAASIDGTRYVADRLPLFIGAVVVVSFLLLLVVFRSLLVPLKAAVMNLLSVAAAYGVVALVVQGGWIGGLIGIDEPVPVPSFIPMMMFAILFGLSMDYEVFLLSRIREEYLATGDNASAVAAGLAKTARVITAAAAIMVAVFGAFVLADEVFLKMIGVGLAAAIFVDATLVRMVLVPATMELLGDANWWLPRWLDRIVPRLDVDAAAAVTPVTPVTPERAPTPDCSSDPRRNVHR